MIRDRGLLDDGSRSVRAVRAGEAGPWVGALVRTKDGGSRVLVDAAEWDAGKAGWAADPGGHVLAPLDVVRAGHGHAALLPVCAERLEDFVRRRAARAPLSSGEAITLGVSILRGCEQLVGVPDLSGEWWLDDAGRPVLAVAAAAAPARDAAAEMLAAIAVDSRLAPAWRAVREAVTAERMTRRHLEEAEEELFRVAEAEPLVTVVLGPRRAIGDASAAAGPPPIPDDAAPRPLWHQLAAHVDADLADTVSRVTTAVWRRARTYRRGRRAPWAVAAVVAAGVVAVGALWPAPGDDEVTPAVLGAESAGEEAASGSAAGDAGAPGGSPTAEPAAGESDAAAHAEEPVAAAAAVLDGRRECSGDDACLAEWVADPAASFPAGVVDLPGAERSVALLDELGDLVVLRVDAADKQAPAQLIVLIRRQEKWLLRDVHDVAQQP